MRIRWSAFEPICRDFSEAAPPGSGFFIEDTKGKVRVGTARADQPASARHRLVVGHVDAGCLNVVGNPGAERTRLCWAVCERELQHQITVNDMADATARLWRQTNALMRMSAATSLAMEPGAMFERVLGQLARSTNLEIGIGVVRLAGRKGYVVVGEAGGVDEKPADAAACDYLLALDDDVLLVGEDTDQRDLRAACGRLLPNGEAFAIARLMTDSDRYGFLLVPLTAPERVTSEDLKMFSAAAQALSVATENAHTLLKEREATRLQVENELLNAQARDMEEMLHVVAHDLRSPMTAIYGFMHVSLDASTELLAELAESGVDQELLAGGVGIEKPLESGIRSVEKLNRMVQRLLDFSRVARLAYKFENLDLDEIASVVVTSLGFQLETSGIEVEVGSLGNAVGDRVQLEAVFGNLVDNAIKYIGKREPRRIEIGVDEIDGQRAWFVKDTGIGMTADQVGKAFLPFQRFRTDAAPGEGIGLSYVLKIVERHGGRIWCESQEGQGTTFYFTLGVLEESPAEPSSPSA